MSALDGRQKMYPVFTRDPTRTDVPQLPSAASYGEGIVQVDGILAYSDQVSWRLAGTPQFSGENLPSAEIVGDGNTCFVGGVKRQSNGTEFLDDRVIPSQNLVPGVIGCDIFTGTTGWSQYSPGTGTPTWSTDTDHLLYDSKSLRLANLTAGASSYHSKRKTISGIRTLLGSTVPIDLSAVDGFNFWIYQEPGALAGASNGSSSFIRLASIADFSNRMHNDVVNASYDALRVGWNNIGRLKSSFTETGTMDWSNVVGIEVSFLPGANYVANKGIVYAGMVVGGAPTKAKFCMTFDDGVDDQYDLVRIFNYYGIPCTLYIIPNLIDVAGYLTTAQCDALYAAGNDLGVHHEGVDEFASNPYAMETSRRFLLRNGWTRGANYVAYPNGSYNGDTIAAAKNIGILSGRTISGKTYSTASGYTVYQSNVSSLGIEHIAGGGFADRYALHARGTSGVAAGTLTGYVDNAISYGGVYMPFSHTFTELSLATADTLAAYVATKVASGDIEVHTHRTLWESVGSPFA